MRFATRVARIQKLFIPRNVEKGKALLDLPDQQSIYFSGKRGRKGRRKAVCYFI
jgi:hypothetical protein